MNTPARALCIFPPYFVCWGAYFKNKIKKNPFRFINIWWCVAGIPRGWGINDCRRVIRKASGRCDQSVPSAARASVSWGYGQGSLKIKYTNCFFLTLCKLTCCYLWQQIINDNKTTLLKTLTKNARITANHSYLENKLNIASEFDLSSGKPFAFLWGIWNEQQRLHVTTWMITWHETWSGRINSLQIVARTAFSWHYLGKQPRRLLTT